MNRRLCIGNIWKRNVSWSMADVEDLPRITMPQKMIAKLNKVVHDKRQSDKRKGIKRNSQVIISCKRKEFNHHSGQVYREFSVNDLASHGWKHYKSKGDRFTINRFEGNPALLNEITDFESLGINKTLIEKLEAADILNPTNIQSLAIPLLMDRRNILCAAETGSGKTLAYLLPTIQHILEYKRSFGPVVKPGSPTGVVLVPSRELASQILAVLHQLDVPGLTHVGAIGGGRAYIDSPIDIMVATPGILKGLVSKRVCNLSGVQHLVLDEADTLLDDSFNGLTASLIRSIHAPSSNENPASAVVGGTQVMMVGATLPKDLTNIVGGVVELNDFETVTTNSIHRLMPHVTQKFMRLGSDQKPEAILGLVKLQNQRRIPTIVFCNTAATCNWLSYFLTDNNVEHLRFNSGVDAKERLHTFTKFRSGECNLLISTDIGSRGLDTINCQHVINYNFPDFMSDYIHRVGRVGRVGSKTAGHVVNFVSKVWEVDLVWKIEQSARLASELFNVNANIKRKLKGRHAKLDEETQYV